MGCGGHAQHCGRPGRVRKCGNGLRLRSGVAGPLAEAVAARDGADECGDARGGSGDVGGELSIREHVPVLVKYRI